MPVLAFLSRTGPFVALFAAMASGVLAQTPLPKESPFLPASSAATAAPAAAEVHELAGVSTMGKQTSVYIFDKQTKVPKGKWIPVGETMEGITVLNYDSPREQVLIRVGGVEKTLKLRKSTSNVNGVAAVGAPPPLPGPLPRPGGWNAPQVPTPPVAPPVAVAPVTTPAQKPEPPPPIGSVAHQEQEARMLVSDLLEIGMAQRKAYEEAQKKAAGTAVPTADPSASPATPPAPPSSK
ncbi:MAG: hypothetical protein ABIZ49_14400 [Opitutaceae bacterium]